MQTVQSIAGVDEVGRGPLAGPVVAAAAVFRPDYKNSEIQDSKKLSQKKREQLIAAIKKDAIAYSIVAVGPETIDAINIREATKVAMSKATSCVSPDFVLIDGNMTIDTQLPQKTVVGGDRLHVEIAAASILAKVWRDSFMEMLGERYPGYGLETHAGYPTKKHRAAILELGPTPIHRRTFKGVREFSNETNFSTKKYSDAYPLEEIQEVYIDSDCKIRW